MLLIVCLVVSLWSLPAGAQTLIESDQFLKANFTPPRALTPAEAAEVEKLLAQMTLKEKAGQMTQLEIGMISDGQDQQIRINPDKLRKAVVEYGVGSILNVKDEALSTERWHEIIRQIQAAAGETRLKIPILYGIDSIHGANYVQSATLFPQQAGMAATWNPELVLEASRFAAAETRAAGIPWTFSPLADVGRHPAWPRLYETFGEDPYLASVMGVAAVRGYEGGDLSSPRQVASCLKHYVGYSFPLTGHDRTPALIPDAVMWEYFLPPFVATIRAGAHTVMVNSGSVNGIPGHVNRHLLTDVLRGRLGFAGVVVSDWEDIKKLVTIHRVAENEEEATRQAVLAGIDMSMVPSDYSFADLLLQLAQEGKVPVSRIDEAVRRILILKRKLGLFDDPLRGMGASEVGSAEARRAALESAQESVTLLKNEKDFLPLAKSARILVTGPTSDSLIPLNNGWTYHWQGDRPALYPKEPLTILGAIRAAAGAPSVAYAPGTEIERELDIAAAVRAAKDADVIVACLGEWSYTETPGNIDDLTLPEPQLRLVEQLATTGKPIVLVMAEGRPRIIRRIADLAGAIVMAYNPGNLGGQAVADVLFGDVNPSGKLPFTYPRSPNALLTYDRAAFQITGATFGLKSFAPQYEFGHGLSYTSFAYSELKLDKLAWGPQEPAQASVRVTNTGQRAGKEVVQLYVTALVSRLAPPSRRLRRFAKVHLEPGESRTLRFTLEPADFSYYDEQGKLVLDPGSFEVAVGSLRQAVTISGGAAGKSSD
jgi:beta-glucosidase